MNLHREREREPAVPLCALPARIKIPRIKASGKRKWTCKARCEKLQKFCGEVGYAVSPESNLEVYPFTFARRERLKKARTSASKIAIRIRLVEKPAAARARARARIVNYVPHMAEFLSANIERV